MVIHGVTFPLDAIGSFCRRNGVARLSLFGSILGQAFRGDSDVDVLVEFLPDERPTLFTLGGMEQELSDLLGREVDLRTPNEISPRFRDEVVTGSRLLHAA